jgi:DNA-binding response OmpR family regulator
MLLIDEKRRFRARILLIEGDSLLRRTYTEELRRAGYNVQEAGTRQDGLAILDQAPGIELIICSYDLGEKAPHGSLALANSIQSLWSDSRPDRPPSILLIGALNRPEQEILAEEHGAYFVQNRILEIFSKADMILMGRRRQEHQELFLIEHIGRLPGTTYCTPDELTAAVHMRHRTRTHALACALRERLVFDALAKKNTKWVSLEELKNFMGNSVLYSRHAGRDWQFSRRSLKVSLHLLRAAINTAATELHSDIRADQLLMTHLSGRYERLYQLNCGVGWRHP